MGREEEGLGEGEWVEEGEEEDEIECEGEVVLGNREG